MFGGVWRWAGTFRKDRTEYRYRRVPYLVDFAALDDCQYWIEHGPYNSDEIAARFHHRLVLIHPFPNRDGRHARMATDLLLVRWAAPVYLGRVNLVDPGETRQHYVDALRAADHHDIGPLLEFVRSLSKRGRIYLEKNCCPYQS